MASRKIAQPESITDTLHRLKKNEKHYRWDDNTSGNLCPKVFEDAPDNLSL